jgi:hypothetical protein
MNEYLVINDAETLTKDIRALPLTFHGMIPKHKVHYIDHEDYESKPDAAYINALALSPRLMWFKDATKPARLNLLCCNWRQSAWSWSEHPEPTGSLQRGTHSCRIHIINVTDAMGMC